MGILNFYSPNSATLMVTQTHSVRVQWWVLVDRAPDRPHIPSNCERLILITWHRNMSMWEVHEGLSRRGVCVCVCVCVSWAGAAELRVKTHFELKFNLPSPTDLTPLRNTIVRCRPCYKGKGSLEGLASRKSKENLPASPSLRAANKAPATHSLRTNGPQCCPAEPCPPGGFC